MSAQFGRWNLDGMPVDAGYLEKAKIVIAPYGPDGEGSYTKHSLAIVYCAFHTTRESRCETQPYITTSGTVITWDGRLDNRAELISSFSDLLTADSTDLSIVAAAYERWGTDCFSNLIGDWALAIWSPDTRSLVLAKDPVGTRHLYYSFEASQVTWSTILDPLVLLAGKTFALCEEYIAGWLSFFPAAHLTPYVGIRSVPPSSFVRIQAGKHAISKYWDFDPDKRIVYRTDTEYEEHFRSVFGEAVRRRLRSDSPILAELSGGMDSSSIVCMGDAITARGGAQTPRLDTISYYSDLEPNWNERPYFARVEEKRGRSGFHINVGMQDTFKIELNSAHFAATPSSVKGDNEINKQFAALVTLQGNRALLSGIGGDEFTGGVPTPTAELADLLVCAKFGTLARQLKSWALSKRKPLFHLFFEAARGFFPPAFFGLPKHRRPAPWLNREFIERNRAALRGYEKRLKLFGAPPSFQSNLGTLDMLQRQLLCSSPCSSPLCEARYPYLDRNFLEFVYAVPTAQSVRPGQRRSLMRRALVGIVPDEILNRKRKAYVTKGPRMALSSQSVALTELSRNMLSSTLGAINAEAFSEALHRAGQDEEVPIVRLIRTLSLEIWLRNLERCSALMRTNESAARPLKYMEPIAISAGRN